jgi:hypothetical protein
MGRVFGTVLTILVILASAFATGAPHQATAGAFPLIITASQVCDETTGTQIVTWELLAGEYTDIVISPGAATGAAVGVVTWADPFLAAQGESTTGQTLAGGDVAGDVLLSVSSQPSGNQVYTQTQTYTLTGGCFAAATTTATATAATTTTAPALPATTVDPSAPSTSAAIPTGRPVGTGTGLPNTGRPIAPWVVAALVLLIGGFAAVRVSRGTSRERTID